MDGRVQDPVAAWMKKTYNADYVDTITEPGPNGILATGDAQRTESIKARVHISAEKHNSRVVAVVGHGDCAGNPVPDSVNRDQVRTAVDVVRSWGFNVAVIGLWLNSDNWQVELIVPAESESSHSHPASSAS